MRNVAWKLVPGVLFNFQRIFCKKESEEVCRPIWTSFDSFTITYQAACFRNFIFQ